MTDYTELVKALRYCDSGKDCKQCQYYEPDEKNVRCIDMIRAAADAIEELSRRLEQALYTPPPRWISVEERLPEKSGNYLAVITGKTGEVYYGHESRTWLDPGDEWENWTRFVTHWMPLPEPPEEET